MNQLAEKILARIRDHGPISFAEFMKAALYCPVYGYYEKEGDTPGRQGDYYTSVSVGPLFGELLALQFAQWLDRLKEGAANAEFRPSIVEAGAHNGQLAGDILTWLHRQRPDMAAKVEYTLVEPSERRQEWQRAKLASFAGQVRWVKSLAEAATGSNAVRGIRGIAFCNELLDAMPVHRLAWDAAQGTWFEWGVGFEFGRFCWKRLAQPCCELPAWPNAVLAQLPNGFTLELCPAAHQWWSEAARVLRAGKLVAIDYGFASEPWETPEREHGTLRAYHRHLIAPDVLANPGEQDITAHVNFYALRQAGEASGLSTESFVTQEQFLTSIAAPTFQVAASFGDWTLARIRQFQTLTHPAHLGHSFRVLVQSANGP